MMRTAKVESLVRRALETIANDPHSIWSHFHAVLTSFFDSHSRHGGDV